MKLLVAILLSIHAVCGLNVLKRLKRDSFLVGGATNTDGTTAKAMVYVDAGVTKCSGVCISNRVVLTCGACTRAAASPTSIKLYSGPSKTSEGTIKEVRYTKDKEVAIIIIESGKELSTCKPVNLPCKKKDVPPLESTVMLSGWGMTSMSPETEATTVQALQMKWSGDNTCCAGMTGVKTNGKKNICMYTTMPTQATCYGDCGAPVFNFNLVVGIVIRNYPDCELKKCSVVASLFPRLDEILGPQGAGAFMEDKYSPAASVTATKETGKELPHKITKAKDCLLIDVKFKPDKTDTTCNTKKTTKTYGTVVKDTGCQLTKAQKPGIVLNGKKLSCNTETLKAANGCPCCKKGDVMHRCYKPCKTP